MFSRGIEDAVQKSRLFLGRKFLSQLERLVNHYFRGRGSRAQFENREPQNISVHRRQALEPPILRKLLDQLVIRFRLLDGPLEELPCEFARRISRARRLPKMLFDFCGLLTRHVPLEKHLQSKFA